MSERKMPPPAVTPENRPFWEAARCKRPSARAPQTLAARSEDWERRTLWGIRPRRVLGLVRDELFDIYENRVAVALVDYLDRALLLRLRSVRRVVKLLEQREN